MYHAWRALGTNRSAQVEQARRARPGALLPGVDREAEAATRCGTEFYYYSDATYSEVVGVWGWLPEACGCRSYLWGTMTLYRTVQDSYCG